MNLSIKTASNMLSREYAGSLISHEAGIIVGCRMAALNSKTKTPSC